MESRFRPKTLVELLRGRGQNQPDRRAYTVLFDDESEEFHLSYGELDRQAQAIAALLQDLRMEGERALLLYPPGLEYIAAFFGCLYAGVIAVPVYPPDPARLERTLPRLRAIAKDAQVTVVLTTQAILSMAEILFEEVTDLKSLQWKATDNIGDVGADDWKAPRVSEETLAFIQYTSGSTTSPKGVMLSHGNLTHNLSQIQNCFKNSAESLGVIWLPPYHDMGLIGGVIEPVYGGHPVILMSPLAFLQKPIRWLDAISRFSGTHSGGPNFSYDLCVRKISKEQRNSLDLSSWDIAFCGAEPVRRETIDSFVEAFEPCGFRQAAFYPCYGLAESTLIVSGGVNTKPPVVASLQREALHKNQVIEAAQEEGDVQPLVGCGQSLPEQKIVIVDPETFIECPPDQIGEIWVSGPSVAQGYWNRAQETEETFRAFLRDSGAGPSSVSVRGPFLRTGDLGFLKKGELFVTGRIKDLIVIRGQNHYPQDIEMTVERSDPQVRPGCGAAFSVEVHGEERLVIVQEVNASESLDADKVIHHIRQSVYQRHEMQAYAVVLIEPRSIPKTSSGKIQRSVCRTNFLEGCLAVVVQWKEDLAPSRHIEHESDPMLQTPVGLIVLEVLAEVLPERATITEESSLTLDLGLDSLATIEFWAALEETFGIMIPDEAKFALREVSDVIAYLESQAAVQEKVRDQHVATENDGRHSWGKILEIRADEAQRMLHDLNGTHSLVRSMFLKVFRGVFSRMSNLSIEGLENLPQQGPYILAPNHESHLDNLFVACFLPRWAQQNMAVVGKKEHFENAFTRVIAKLCYGLQVDRTKVSSVVLQICAQLLKQGKVLLVHPEGTRSPDGKLQPFKNGVGLLAHYVQCPIVPVYIEGAYEFWPKDAFLPRRRSDISVTIDKPLYPTTRSNNGVRVLTEAEYLTSRLTKRMMTLQKDVNDSSQERPCIAD